MADRININSPRHPLCAQFKAARKQLGLTLWNVSARTGLSESTISLAERTRYSRDTKTALLGFYSEHGLKFTDVDTGDRDEY